MFLLNSTDFIVTKRLNSNTIPLGAICISFREFDNEPTISKIGLCDDDLKKRSLVETIQDLNSLHYLYTENGIKPKDEIQQTFQGNAEATKTLPPHYKRVSPHMVLLPQNPIDVETDMGQR